MQLWRSRWILAVISDLIAGWLWHQTSSIGWRCYGLFQPLLPRKSQSECVYACCKVHLVECFGTYCPAESGVWGGRDVVVHAVPPFGTYRQKITPKMPLSFMTVLPQPLPGAMTACQGRLDKCGVSSWGRRVLEAHSFLEKAGRGHAGHQQPCWPRGPPPQIWTLGSVVSLGLGPALSQPRGDPEASTLNQGLAAALSLGFPSTLPSDMKENRRKSQKNWKKSSPEQARPWFLPVGHQARAAGESKRIWGLAFPNNWQGQSWIWGLYCKKHQPQTCSLLCAPHTRAKEEGGNGYCSSIAAVPKLFGSDSQRWCPRLGHLRSEPYPETWALAWDPLRRSQQCPQREELLCFIADIILPVETIHLGSNWACFPFLSPNILFHRCIGALLSIK